MLVGYKAGTGALAIAIMDEVAQLNFSLVAEGILVGVS
jgi:hypothetical protein